MSRSNRLNEIKRMQKIAGINVLQENARGEIEIYADMENMPSQDKDAIRRELERRNIQYDDNDPFASEGEWTLTGNRRDLIAFLTSPVYGVDPDEMPDIFPELYDNNYATYYGDEESDDNGDSVGGEPNGGNKNSAFIEFGDDDFDEEIAESN